MFCKKCGKLISMDDNFCNFCGTKISDEIKITDTLSKKFLSNRKLLTCITIVVVITIVIIVTYEVDRIKDYQEYERLVQANLFENSNNEREIDFFNQLEISNITIRPDYGDWSKTYATIKNNGDTSITGYLKAVIYLDDNILDSVLLSITSSGLASGESTVVDGYVRTSNIIGYNSIKIYGSTLMESD